MWTRVSVITTWARVIVLTIRKSLVFIKHTYFQIARVFLFYSVVKLFNFKYTSKDVIIFSFRKILLSRIKTKLIKKNFITAGWIVCQFEKHFFQTFNVNPNFREFYEHAENCFIVLNQKIYVWKISNKKELVTVVPWKLLHAEEAKQLGFDA
jgi:hypothetical protein